MKHLYTALIFATTFTATPAAAQQEQLLKVEAVETNLKLTEDNQTTHYYYYNEQNQLFWEQDGTVRRCYSYDAEGRVSEVIQYAWITASGNYTKTQRECYTYDADGNLSEKVIDKTINNPYGAVWTYTYADYVKGMPTYCDEYKNGVLYYMYKLLPVFDAKGLLVKCTDLYANPDDYTNPTHSTVSYEKVSSETTKKYDDKGLLIGEEVDKTKTFDYSYAGMKASYTPQNLMAQTSNDQVTITWDAVAGAEKYIVSYDQQRVEVGECQFTTAVGMGEREFTVQAVIDGVERNAATPVSTMVFDLGNLPVTQLSVGKVSETFEKTESTAMGGVRQFYLIPLSWTMPEGHSAVQKFIVYYDSRTYGEGCSVGVQDANATSYTLKIDPYEVADYDENGNPCKGYDTNIAVSVLYSSGESEKSNTVTINPFNLIHAATGIRCAKVTATTAPAAAFTPAGLPAKTKGQGIVIKQGKKFVR
ncbi:MAG: hypothetical protein KBT12_04945 [Bacteroidales bacterium]|nr:hypothetical protein [Candidatus Physcousia equi]